MQSITVESETTEKRHSKQPLGNGYTSYICMHGLPVLISKVEYIPTAHEVKVEQRNLLGRTHLLVPHQLVYLCRQHPTIGVLPQESFNNAQNEDAYTTQVQMSMSTVSMQQVWPERSQDATDKQQTM